MNRNNREFLAAYVSQRMDMGESEWFLRPADVIQAVREETPPPEVQRDVTGMNETRKNTAACSGDVSDSSIASPQSLDGLNEAVCGCQRCGLGATRTNFVFGSGNPDADIMFIGEAPGADEDAQGLPFVGRAGKLLTKMIVAMQLTREDVYIGNILKCRPPNNRDPKPEEIDLCEPILLRQIEIIKPKVICALGRISGQTLLRTKATLGALRGTIHDYHGVKFIVTYHPAALLRNPNWKKGAWDDLKIVRREFDGLEL